jgi:hypothetical protein
MDGKDCKISYLLATTECGVITTHGHVHVPHNCSSEENFPNDNQKKSMKRAKGTDYRAGA